MPAAVSLPEVLKRVTSLRSARVSLPQSSRGVGAWAAYLVALCCDKEVLSRWVAQMCATQSAGGGKI